MQLTIHPTTGSDPARVNIKDEQGNVIAALVLREHAELIVCAVNAHASLVAVAEEALSYDGYVAVLAVTAMQGAQ